MILLCEHPVATGCESAPSTPTVWLAPTRATRQQELFGRGSEHVWQHRFHDFNVWSARKRIEKLRYMHRNPVQRGLVQQPEQWRWSSFRSYAYGEVGAVRINLWGPVILQQAEKVE